MKAFEPSSLEANLFGPKTLILFLIKKSTNPFTKGSQPEFSTNEREIRYLARIGDEEGVIEHDEYEMIQGVFKLNDVTAKDLMAGGWKPGPSLGEELRRLRWQRLEQVR